jgi:hypothetical protein
MSVVEFTLKLEMLQQDSVTDYDCQRSAITLIKQPPLCTVTSLYSG